MAPAGCATDRCWVAYRSPRSCGARLSDSQCPRFRRLRDHLGRSVGQSMTPTAAHPYLRYLRLEALHPTIARGTLTAWSFLASFAAARLVAGLNARMTCTTMPARRHRASLCRSPVRRPIRPNECSVIRGRLPDGLPRTTSRPGPSPMIGPIGCRSRSGRWMCSRLGSAMSSTSYSGRAIDVRSSLS